MRGNATEIIPRLFLGTREDAEALGPHVPDDWACFSVTEYRSRYGRKEELPNEPDGSIDMPFMADRPDGWHADRHKLDLIAELIWWRLQEGKKVLVHCIHAQERSPLAVVWYLVWSGEAPTLARAYEIVTQRHPRTERRDKWLRGSTPKKRAPDLFSLLEAARTLSDAAAVDTRTLVTDAAGVDALFALVSAACAWTATTTGVQPAPGLVGKK
jgi:hypothetical protein